MKLLQAFLSPFTQVRKLGRPAKLFLLALLLDGFLFAGWNLFFNFYILEAGFSREYLGLINATPSIAALIFGVPMGMLSDRIGRKRAMILGFTIANASVITMCLVRQPLVMLAMASCLGISGQLYVLSQAPFMMKVSDDASRDLLFSVSFGVIPLANTFGNAVAGLLPGLFGQIFDVDAHSALAYRAVLLTCAISSYLVLLPIALIREPQTKLEAARDAAPSANRQRVWKVLARPLTLKLSLPNLITGFGAALLIPYLNIFFVERHSVTDQTLGLLFSASALLIGIASFIGPRLVGNLGGKIRMIVLVQAISLVFLLIMGFSSLLWLAVIGFLVRGTLMNMVAPLFDAFAMEQTPEAEQGAVNSIRAWAWNAGWAVGPYISGLVQERWGFMPLFVTTGILYAIGIGLTWIFFRPKARQIPAPVPIEN
jgi:MFS family permease